MMRLVFSLISIISLLLASCGNGDVKTDATIPSQERNLRDLVARHPDSLMLKENLVEYLSLNGQYEEAIRETENVLKTDSMNDRFLNINATLRYENGDTAGAIKSFEKAVQVNPRPEYIMLLGSIYAQTKNPMALQMADALMHVPAMRFQKEALFIKGLYHNYTGDKSTAISFFDACLKIDYRYMLAYREKAICLYDLRKYAEALVLLNQAITVQKSFDEGYYWLGRCYEKLGKRNEAIESYQAALILDSNYVEAREALKNLENNK